MNDVEVEKSIGKVEFESSSTFLNKGFTWAKQEALSYAHNGEDVVGLWYEAALPGRAAFCMRDVAHQSAGAAILGLQNHTKNMLSKFAEGISSVRDWCSYWEINKENTPAPVDYQSDSDFWYNLPANFDILDTCYRQFLWTGDTEYLNNPKFITFYEKTINEYVRAWDKDNDGLMEHYPEYGRRGIASYNEDGLQPLIAGDLISAQYAGYSAFAKINELKGNHKLEKVYKEKAAQLQKIYQNDWWNEGSSRFYGARLQNGEFYEPYYDIANFLPLYFGLISDKEKLKLALKDVKRNGVVNVEGKSYFPEIYYKNGDKEEAYAILLELIDPSLIRREYPEVSYAVIGSIATGMMGISANGDTKITTMSQLPNELEWAIMRNVPILNNVIDISHNSNRETSLTNRSGNTLTWKVQFSYKKDQCLINNVTVDLQHEYGLDGVVTSFAIVTVNEGETICASAI
ncbi:MGH1-like glycoside hydrolase domain-containing protein [Viridibacillus arvi]|uniref:MGH1-like glycoside hydrolase domain-containing protein n=1 Tax=Viridibacillus arvi TaxID=263475 RepID=UPI00187B82BA|nr:hypothetical protein [Viridibacillus sp. JNUCC-6]QOV11150.1 hypothetical protein JNUCC6_21780 [Viridibacillus sp. JNUCC-6]